MACHYPGCVVLPEGKSRYCIVHRDSLNGGKACEACQGKGYLRLGAPCPDCGGVGLRDAHRSTVIPKKDRVPVDDRDLLKKMR